MVMYVYLTKNFNLAVNLEVLYSFKHRRPNSQILQSKSFRIIFGGFFVPVNLNHLPSQLSNTYDINVL